MAITTEPNLRSAKLAFEDYMNVVKRHKPAATPVYTMAGTEYELENTEYAWQVDSWATPNGAKGPGDGYAVQSAEIADNTARRRKMGNYGQAFRRAYGTGWIANRVPRLAGGNRGNMFGAKQDATELLKRDIDCAFCSWDQTAIQDVGSSSGSITASIKNLIDPANKYAAASSFAYGKPTDLHYAPTGAIVTGVLATAFNLAALKTVAKALRQTTRVNKDYVLLAGLDLREAVTALTDPITVTAGATGTGAVTAATQTRNFTQSISDSELGISIDVIRTDFGRFLVVPTDNLGTTTTDGSSATNVRADRVFVEKAKYGLVLSRDMLAMRWGVPLESEKLAPDGASQQEVLRGFAGLVVYNPQGFGYLELT
jgi:hypothetical protein